MVALGGLGTVLVQRTFEEYEREWDRRFETIAAEKLFTPLANEVARSLLLKIEQGQPERREQIKRSVGDGLDRILPTIPSIERLLILGPDLEIQYATESLAPGSFRLGEELVLTLDEELPVRRDVRLPSGEDAVEVLIPVYDGVSETSPADEQRQRLGSVLIRYRPDPELAGRLAALRVDMGQSLVPAIRGASGELPSVEELYSPWISEVAHSLLIELAKDDLETREAYQVSVSDGLNQLIAELPMETLVIVDRNNRIQYVNDPEYLDLTYTRAEYTDLFASEKMVRKPIALASGKLGVEIMLPVFESDRRLGSVLVHYRPDPGLAGRLPGLTPPRVGLRDYIQPLILFFVVAVGGGILLAGLSAWPVRRMDRALADYRARGFKGGIDTTKVGLPSDLASTVRAISELGGRLESLDAQGREREAMLETLSQTLEDGMIAINPALEPVAWNPAALRILAGRQTELDSEEHDEAAATAALKEALERNVDLQVTIRSGEIGSREVAIQHEDGGSSLARVTQVPVVLGPDLTGTLLLIRDLAALRKVEEHLLDAGRFAVLAHLAASLAHEIRNPLHSIQLNASVVEQYATRLPSGADPQAVSESLAMIKSEAMRLSDLLNNYLGMVRPNADAGPVNLCDLSRRVMQLVDFVARKSNVEIRLEGEESPPMVYGVANRLQQAILNLVLNAIQAMPDGGVVTLRVDSFAENVRLAVSDTGPGLPQELADQLFDTRVTTKEEGSGLGLPLVRMIVESHGGGVWYRSTPGQGASFMMALPVMGKDSARPPV